MSQRDNFTKGFLVGALVGGAVGGLLGAIVTSRYGQPSPLREDDLDEDTTGEDPNTSSPGSPNRRRSLYRRRMDEARLENARRSLEGKIAQLNEAIDDVRQQFDDPHGQPLTPLQDLPNSSGNH